MTRVMVSLDVSILWLSNIYLNIWIETNIIMAVHATTS